MIKVLIVGEDSFIGNAVLTWLEKYPDQYSVDVIDAINQKWRNADFSVYDVVYQVAGIAHVAVETPEMEELFFKVNADMSADIAEYAKAHGVKQYIFMSTKGVYPSFVPVIDKDTQPNPPKLYGKSKLAGERRILSLSSDNFTVSVLRPPAVYGINAPGSFSNLLGKLDKLFVFPAYKNRRSMICIDNLCEFIRIVIDRKLGGILVPQDAEYMSTSNIIRVGAKIKNKRIVFDYISWPIISVMVKLSYRFRKPFGSTVYIHNYSIPDSEYNVCRFEDAVRTILENEKR